MTLFLLSAPAFFLPLTWGGVIYPWSSWRTFIPLLLGSGGLIFYAYYELHLASNTLMPLASLFTNRTACISYAGSLVHGILLLMLIYYLPLYYIGVHEYSPKFAGVAAFPETLTIAPAAVAAGFGISTLGRYREILWLGWLLTTFGMGLMCILDVNTSVPSWVFINMVPGLGLGILIPAQSTAIQAATNNENAGYAISMSMLIRSSGQAVGVAIGGTVFQNMLKNAINYSTIRNVVTAEALIRTIQDFPGSQAEKRELNRAIVEALRSVWGTGCGLAGVAGLASLLTKSLSLENKG
jgi:hypothetical protein